MTKFTVKKLDSNRIRGEQKKPETFGNGLAILIWMVQGPSG